MLVKSLFLVASIVFLVTTMLLAVASIRLRRAAKKEYDQILWIRAQARRAIEQIKSENPDEIVTGLQNLRALRDPGVSFEAVCQLQDLIDSDNREISEQANATYKSLVRTISSSAKGTRWI